MRIKSFNKDKALIRLNNKKNNYKIKLLSIFIVFIALIGTIVYFSQARFESKTSYSLMNGIVTKRIIYANEVYLSDNKTVQQLIDEIAELLK